MLLTCRRALWRAAAAIAAAGFAATVSAVPAFAADAAEVVNATAAEVVELVKAKTGVERQAGFATILESRFDLPAMGQSALGTHWARSNEDQRTRFLKAAAFSEARAYSERFGQYGGQTVVVGRVLNRPNGIFIVESLLNQANGQPIKIDWRLPWVNTDEGRNSAPESRFCRPPWSVTSKSAGRWPTAWRKPLRGWAMSPALACPKNGR